MVTGIREAVMENDLHRFLFNKKFFERNFTADGLRM
jgi:hypothetical protein